MHIHADLYLEIQGLAASEACGYTVHVLSNSGDNVSPLGTAVLIKINKLYFLISAAHVMENYEDRYVGINENTLLRLGGEINYNSLASGVNREDDKIDIAFMLLCDKTVATLKTKYRFLDESNIEISHDLKELPLYKGIGFPASKSKFNKYTNELKSIPFLYTTSPEKQPLYDSMEYDFKNNIIVKYERKSVTNYETGLKSKGPESYGMSGGGLWYIPMQLPQPTGEGYQTKLIGILTDWPTNQRNCWVATRIDIFIESIRAKYKIDFPKSKFVNVEEMN